jgi:hypothetical protein
LIKAVLEPSDAIAIGYGTTLVETKSGETVYGVIKQSTESSLELQGANGQAVRIAKSDIKEQRTSELSLMPAGLAAGLTLEEFSDVVAYLEESAAAGECLRVHARDARANSGRRACGRTGAVLQRERAAESPGVVR